MKIKITGIIIMAVFAGTLIFSMCSKNQPKTDHQIYIGVACYDQKDTFIGELLDSFKEECSSMEKQGYAISSVKNYFSHQYPYTGYKGMHINFISPYGQ